MGISGDVFAWIAFNVFVLTMLILDLYVFHRGARVIHYKEAILVSALWVCLALLFCVGIYYVRGTEPALNFLAGYLLEKGLSSDNLFVFLVIFSAFAVPEQYLHRILFWGVFGALVMRALFIFAGIVLINQFSWMTYLFGVVLLITSLKLILSKGDAPINLEKNVVLKLLRKVIPITSTYVNDNFFVKKEGRYWGTPLVVVLVMIETTDILFAVDSVPAIIGITTDPFIVYTSNVFAILGLRSMYFALSHLMKSFHYLHYGLAFLLAFIGVKMLLTGYVHIPTTIALVVIAATLAIAVSLSLLLPTRTEH